MDSGAIISTIVEALNAFWNSTFLEVLKFLIGIYVLVLFADVVLLLIVRGVGGDIQKTIKGTNMPLTSRKKMRKNWQKIVNRLKTDDPLQYKLAVLEADNLIDGIMIKMGYAGKNMKERLDELEKERVDNASQLRESHRIRNKIIQDKNYILIKQDAEKVIQPYREFLEYFEII